MKFGAIILSNVILLGWFAITEAKPFINPFNVAIKTEYGEEGNTLSFVYPKNSYRVNVNFNRERLNGHEFNIGQFFGHIARSIGKTLSGFNPFALSGGFSKQTTTTEGSIDFGPDDGFSVSASTEEIEKEADGGVSGNGHSTDEEVSTSTGYKINLPTIPITTPSTIYLPPNTQYLPPKKPL